MDTLEYPVVEPDGTAAAGAARSVGWGPVDRPPFASRVFVGLIGLGAMLCTVALLLSDRAPGALRAMFGDRARQLWARIDASERVDLPAESDLPATDFLVHIAIWAVVATLVGLAIWSWRGLIVVTISLFVSSLVLELAQGRYATTRAVELRDAVGNLIGIGVGIGAVALCYVAWSLVARLVRRTRLT